MTISCSGPIKSAVILRFVEVCNCVLLLYLLESIRSGTPPAIIFPVVISCFKTDAIHLSRPNLRINYQAMSYFTKTLFCSMAVNYPPTTHSLLSLSPFALLSISFRFLLQLQHHSCMVFPYFFLSLIFEMGRSKKATNLLERTLISCILQKGRNLV